MMCMFVLQNGTHMMACNVLYMARDQRPAIARGNINLKMHIKMCIKRRKGCTDPHLRKLRKYNAWELE